MTSATFPRRQARIAAATAGLAAALVLAGCSSDDGGSGDKSTSPSTSATETAGTDGGSGGTSGTKSKLEGSWLATTGGKAVALMVTGKKAALFTTGGTVCSGTATEESGMQMIRLKCTDGNADRAVGMVDSVSGTSLKITWQGGLGKESYVKSEGGQQLPTGLPTASLGS
ncbi:hypothetical protein [Streptomyces sp. NBC_00996]|uniref:hypothetical protein n=1 Tax=Streptomyces sp. NBC_00996 TaxID=2903710 RepID=UPI00386BDAFA|nr:hypothetical protein OG390_29035 [Streptomyces sp. NBC_00996]